MTLPPVSIVLLGLAWFATINAVASAVSWTLASGLISFGCTRRPCLLLGVRLLPGAASALFVLTMFVPAHWRFEPRNTDESFGTVIYALAAVGVALLLRSFGRALAVARAGRRVGACERLPRVAAASSDIYEVRGMSGVALVGVLRPRILVGASVRGLLTPGELEVAVAHEHAHRLAYDNVKRFLMFCAPDMFGGSGAARQLHENWRASAEWLADARAVNGDSRRALNLASALVKVAKLSVASTRPLTSRAWSTLHDPPLLEMRVRRLVSGAAPGPAATSSGCILLVATLAAAGLFRASASAAPHLHQFTESLVHLLP